MKRFVKQLIVISFLTSNALLFENCSGGFKGAAQDAGNSQLASSAPTIFSPVITQQPSSLSVNQGASAILSVVATGTGLSYQWYKNSVALSGAVNAVLSFSSVSASDAGSYFVMVKNSSGNVASNQAELIVNIAPAIAQQPQNVTASVGGSAAFTVAATGTNPLSYQWYKNGVALSGATSSALNLIGLKSTDAGGYSVVITNLAGSVTSSSAQLTVNAAQTGTAPSITTQPISQSAIAGSNVTMSVVAAGTSPFSYQWALNGVNIAGATSATYSIVSVTSAQAGAYSVVVSNSVGSIASSSANLTVNVPPSITSQPVSQTVTTGSSVTFSVVAAGTGTLSYQWKLGGVNISGATSSSYTIASPTTSQSGGSYTVTVSNSSGSVTSSAAVLTVTTVSGSCDYNSSSVLIGQITPTNLGLGSSGPTYAFNFSQFGNYLVQANYDFPGYMPAGITSTYSVWVNGSPSCWGTSFVTGTFQGAPALGVPLVSRGWTMNASAMSKLSPGSPDLWTTKSGMGVSVSTLNSKYNAASACIAGSAANSACLKWSFTAPGLGSGNMNTTTASYSSWDVMVDIYFHGSSNPAAGNAPVLFDLQYYQAYMNDYVNGYLLQYNYPNSSTPPAFKTINGVCYMISVNSWDPYTGASAGTTTWGKDVGQAAVIPIANQPCTAVQSSAAKLWAQVTSGLLWGLGSVKSDLGGIIYWMSTPTTVNGVVGIYDDYGIATIDNGTGKALTQSVFAATIAKINTNLKTNYTDLYLTSINAGVENYYTKDAANSKFITNEFWFAMPGETVPGN